MKTFTVTDQEYQVLLQALGEVPLRIAGPLFTKLQQQFMAQDKPPEAPQSHADKVF
jgi:hypothetical protein